MYNGGDAIEHWQETEYCYSLALETQKVWDYAGDNYVCILSDAFLLMLYVFSTWILGSY